MNAIQNRATAIRSLRVRTLFLVLLAVVPALLLISWSAGQHRKMARQQAVDSIRGLVSIAKEESQGHVDSTRQLLNVLAEMPAVREQDARRSSDLFRRLLAANPIYANIGAARLDGLIFASGHPVRGPVSIADRDYFHDAIRRKSFSPGSFMIGRISGKPSVGFGTPILSGNAEVLGVVFASLDVYSLIRMDAVPLPPGAALTIIDGNGRILARWPNPTEWRGQTLQEDTAFRSMLVGTEGSREAVGLDGVRRLYVYNSLQTTYGLTPVHIVIGVPTATVYAGTDRVYWLNLVGMLLVAVLALLAAWLGGDWFFLRQVKALLRAARRISAGDLSARTGLRYGFDELSQLTSSFDEMAGSLERLTSRHDIILSSAGEGIIGVDIAGNTTFVNPAAARMLGYSSAELIGLPNHDTIHHSRPDGSPYPAEECPAYAACADGTAHRGDDEVFWRKDGTSFPVDYVVAPARESGHVVGAVITFKDITERKQSEAVIREAHEEVLQAEREKKRFYRGAIRSVTQGKLHLVDEGEIVLEGSKVLETSLETPQDDRAARKLLQATAEAAGMSTDRARELVMAAGEATTNAVKHAVSGRAEIYQAPDRVIVRIIDHGAGISEEDLPATLLQTGFSTKVSLGMGYTLMLQLADRVWLATGPSGTVVQVEKWLHPADRPLTPVERALGRFYAAAPSETDACPDEVG